ncbi:MAG: response regulator transcription factor [Vicinamibacteria bacterium]
MEILIVEDDERMAALLKRGLEREGHVATAAADGAEGLDFALARPYDVVILDVMLPVLNGFEVARRLRQRGCRTPILMLTAKDASPDIVHGLDTGADDYLTKPFSFDELLARLRAVARRGPIPRPVVLEVGNLRLDPASHEVSRGDRTLQLTPKEFRLLELLMRRAGKVQSRDAIIEAVWGYDADVELNTVDVFLSTLRRKVDADEDTPLIHTVRGIGYCLKENGP